MIFVVRIKNKDLSIKNYFPILTRLQGYTRQHYVNDILAGLTVGIVLIPQAIAYSYLAGMPPVYGLYAALIPMLLYGLLGTSPQMNVGPVAVSAVLVLAGIGNIADPFSLEYIQLVILTGLVVGIIQFGMGLMRLGFMVNFLSHPVLAGFISAAAVIIIISQIKDLLGISVPRQHSTLLTLIYELQHLDEVHLPSLGTGIGSIVVLFVMKRFTPKIPGIIVVVVLATIASYFFRWGEGGVQLIGSLPSGLPHFEMPSFEMSDLRAIAPTVATVTFIGFVESLSIAKALEMRHRSYRINPNKELTSLGIAKMVGSFFQAIPSSGSFTRSALNDGAGANSGLSSIISALLVGLSLLFLTPLFYHIPQPVLAGIIIFSVSKLIDIQEAKYLIKIRRRDFAMMMVTFTLTVVLGIEIGVLTGVVLSIFYILYQNSRPNVVVLGNISGTTHYRNIKRFPEAVQQDDHLIIRFDNQLFFANSSYFKDEIMNKLDSKQITPKYLILDASNIFDMDSTGLHALEDLFHQLSKRDVQLVISGAKGTVRDIFKRSGFFEKLEKTKHFMYIKNAIAYTESDDLEEWNDAVVQSNY